MMLFNRYPMAAFRIQRDLGDILGGLSRQGESCETGRFRASPQINVWEEDDTLHLEAEVPGVRLDDIEIHVAGQELTIQSRPEETPEDTERRYIRRERASTGFSRTITLPYEVNVDSVEAILDHGILSIALPKAEWMKPRRIAVTAHS